MAAAVALLAFQVAATVAGVRLLRRIEKRISARELDYDTVRIKVIELPGPPQPPNIWVG